MDLAALIDALSRPDAFPFDAREIDVRQTHISVVFLAGEFVYKVKKPVKLPFLDFSSLELRRRFCDEEVRLNRRLAPHVYLGVVPITREAERVRFEGPGAAVEWAVKMRRLPDSATLEARIARDTVDTAQIEALGRRLARFHAQAARNAHIADFGRFDAVALNIRENLTISAPTVGRTMSPAVRERLLALFEEKLAEARELIEARRARGLPCDTHGDLHLDHVYLFPGEPEPADLVIVDCIEFNERFRYTDPVADMAFLSMDLKFHGRRDLAAAFEEAYFAASGDVEGRPLAPLYVAYRAAVRGKVDGMQMAELEIPEPARRAAETRARGHWLMALGELESPGRRPCLVLIGGLPGSGKSTVAAELAVNANFELVRSDVVRKELAGLPEGARSGAAFGAGLYTPDWTDRTYAECVARAEQHLFEGRRVIVDATFWETARRRPFFEAALRWGVPIVFLVCTAEESVIKNRLDARWGDASDADWSVYQQLAGRWQSSEGKTQEVTHSIDTGHTREAALEEARQSLAHAGLDVVE